MRSAVTRIRSCIAFSRPPGESRMGAYAVDRTRKPRSHRGQTRKYDERDRMYERLRAPP
ncbi:hypothetical protein C8Q70DRAFT_1018119 [Cubamyces menziesii]|nr:hypothetical protein C8Q70DRAFT_1018119 [Cubamyces menziesii]